MNNTVYSLTINKVPLKSMRRWDLIVQVLESALKGTTYLLSLESGRRNSNLWIYVLISSLGIIPKMVDILSQQLRSLSSIQIKEQSSNEQYCLWSNHKQSLSQISLRGWDLVVQILESALKETTYLLSLKSGRSEFHLVNLCS